MADLNRFFKRNDIEIEKILYIYHHGRKTIVCKDPGIEVQPQLPLGKCLHFFQKMVLFPLQEMPLYAATRF